MVGPISSDFFSHIEFSPAHRLAFANGLDALAATHLNYWTYDEVREKRDTHGQQGQQSHPVVFIPKKSDTECVPVRRMSSWGFMSFVLAAMNAVINVANNVNNNLNNRNNNKNEHNNNQVNTNIGNSGVMQMAMDAAMGGRRLDPDRLEDLKRRLDASSSPEPRPRYPNELQMAMLMERLYSAERDKTSRTSQEGLRQKVVDLMEKMYKERLSDQHRHNSTTVMDSNADVHFPEQQDRRRRRTLSGRDLRSAKENLVYQAVVVAANHMSLWVEAHTTPACGLADAVCRVNQEAAKLGLSASFLSKSLSLRSLELLMEDNIVDSKFKDFLLEALEKGQEGKECAVCPE